MHSTSIKHKKKHRHISMYCCARKPDHFAMWIVAAYGCVNNAANFASFSSSRFFPAWFLLSRWKQKLSSYLMWLAVGSCFVVYLSVCIDRTRDLFHFIHVWIHIHNCGGASSAPPLFHCLAGFLIKSRQNWKLRDKSYDLCSQVYISCHFVPNAVCQFSPFPRIMYVFW